MGLGQDRTHAPGSAVRQASVARHVMDCTMLPGIKIVTSESYLTRTFDLNFHFYSCIREKVI